MGAGIKKIRELMEEEELEYPTFESNYFFTVTFKRPPMHVPNVPDNVPNDIIRSVYEYIKKNSSASVSEISIAVGRTDRTVKRILKDLKDQGILQRNGSSRSGQWMISKQLR